VKNVFCRNIPGSVGIYKSIVIKKISEVNTGSEESAADCGIFFPLAKTGTVCYNESRI
jgi:hypothetical protein